MSFRSLQRRRALLFPLLLTLAFLSARTSRAQDAEPDRAPPPRIVEAPDPEDDPAPKRDPSEPPAPPGKRSGFEASASLGYAAPSGSATGAPGDDMTATFGGQFPIGFQLGGDVTPALFLGAYGTFAPGGVGGTVDSNCQAGALNCSSISFYGGITVEYRFNAPESLQPWIGYGFGYGTESVSMSSSTQSAWVTGSGWEFGRFRAGVDFLPASVVGLGIYGEVSLDQFVHLQGQNPDGLTYDADVSQKALHEWFSFGIRVRVMP